MNRDDIIRMAREAGIYHAFDSEGQWDGLTNEVLCDKDYLVDKDYKLKRLAEILTPFAALVAAAEREKFIAYPAGDVVGPCICGSWPGGRCLRCQPTDEHCAAIRARGQA